MHHCGFPNDGNFDGDSELTETTALVAVLEERSFRSAARVSELVRNLDAI